MDIYEATLENCPAQEDCSFFHGLYLEGASWDPLRKVLVEARTSEFFEKFPVVRVFVEELKKGEEEAPISEFGLLDNPQASKSELKQMEEMEQLNKEIQKHGSDSNSIRSPVRSPSGDGSVMSSAKNLVNQKSSTSNYNFKIGGDPN